MVPVITQGPMNMSGVLGGSVVFTCTATGIPLPDITWMDEDGNIVTTTSDMIIDGTVIRSTLTLSNLQDEDFDNYTCTATNMFDSDSVTVLLGSELCCGHSLLVLGIDNKIHILSTEIFYAKCKCV